VDTKYRKVVLCKTFTDIIASFGKKIFHAIHPTNGLKFETENGKLTLSIVISEEIANPFSSKREPIAREGLKPLAM